MECVLNWRAAPVTQMKRKAEKTNTLFNFGVVSTKHHVGSDGQVRNTLIESRAACSLVPSSPSVSELGLAIPAGRNAMNIMMSSSKSLLNAAAAPKDPPSPPPLLLVFRLDRVLTDDGASVLLPSMQPVAVPPPARAEAPSGSVGCAWSSQVKMRRGKFSAHLPGMVRDFDVFLQTNIPTHTDQVSGGSGGSAGGGFRGRNEHIPLLKSMLQKAVRRRRVAAAVRLARLMWRLNAGGSDSQGSAAAYSVDCAVNAGARTELLRRLCVIVLEDAGLHPAFPALVWLMVAYSKGFLPAEAEAASLELVLLAVVGDVAASTQRDDTQGAAAGPGGAALAEYLEELYRSCAPGSDGPGTGGGSTGSEAAAQAAAQAALVVSLLLRGAYGGMRGDVGMCVDYAAAWQHRFSCLGPRPDRARDDAACPESDPAGAALMGRYLHGPSFLAPLGRLLMRQQVHQEGAPAYLRLHWHWLCFGSFQSVGSLDGAGAQVAAALQRLMLGGNSAAGAAAAQRLLRCTGEDLAPEGVDFHVDRSLTTGLVAHLVELARSGALGGNACEVPPMQRVHQWLCTEAGEGSRGGGGLAEEVLREEIGSRLASLIWNFRSGTNHRGLATAVSAVTAAASTDLLTGCHGAGLVVPVSMPAGAVPAQVALLQYKAANARFWKVISPVITQYSSRKCSSLKNRLGLE